jgi:hypothetical protein
MNFFEKFQHIDSRIMYLLLALTIALPLLFPINMPIVVSPEAQHVYDAIENMPSDKIAILSNNWAAGTTAENVPQTESLIRHMFMRHKKFAIISFDVQGDKFSYDIASRISKEMGMEYGKDWVQWGYRPFANMALILQGMARDVPNTIVNDMNGTPLSQIPMMKNVKTIKDIGLIAEVTSSGTAQYWVAYIYGPYRTPIVYAPTSVMAPSAFNYLDSGQIKGMLLGMKGAAEYEKLLNRKGFATMGAGSLSSSHLLIILMIILGNIGYLSARRRRALEERG